jgi:hypothetical protein
MEYTFDLLGISPVLDFFNHQQRLDDRTFPRGPAYLGAHDCQLDTFIHSIEKISPQQGWQPDQVVNTVINYWLDNEENVRHWQRRLLDAGKENLLVARVANLQSLRTELESLIGQ